MDTNQRTTDHHRPRTPRHPVAAARLVATAQVVSATSAVLGLWWLLDPGAYPLGEGVSEEPSALVMLLPPVAVAVATLLLGLAGMPLAALLGRVTPATRPQGALLVAGAAYAVFFVMVVPDVQVLAVLGYLVALASPVVVVGLLVAGARGHPRNLVALALIGAAVLFGVVTGHIGEPTVQMVEQIRDGFDRVGLRPVVLGVLVTGGALFALLTIAAAERRTSWTEATLARLDRWGRTATWVAAACPLPYAAVRMTWFTPWPQGAPGGPEAIGPGVRVFGIMLGLAALGGAVLTMGLISRWGEVFPAWLPGLRGRRVPVMAAVLPATIVSVALCASAVSMVMLSSVDGGPWLVAAIPAPVWGPALGLATYAYHRRRTGELAAAGEGRTWAS